MLHEIVDLAKQEIIVISSLNIFKKQAIFIKIRSFYVSMLFLHIR